MNGKYTILLVDDSESDRGIYRRYLLASEDFDYQIIEAESLEEGLALWRSRSPDLVLTDINLPDGSGLELLAAIKNTHPSSKIPIIMMTGQGDERLAVQAMKLGASDYLVKDNITASTLCHYVETAISQWNLSGKLTRLRQQLETQNTALQFNDDIFRAIFDNTFQFIGLLTPDGMLLEANQTALTVGGLQREDVVGCLFWETHWFKISRDTQEKLEQSVIRAAKGEFIRYEVDVWGANQRVITIDFSLRPVFNESGQVSCIIPEGRDITDQKEAELLLRQQALVFENITDGVIIADMDGIIIDWNRGAENLYGYTKAEILGQSPSILHRPEEAEELSTKIIQTTLQKGSWSGEFTVICKDGTEKITATSTVFLQDATGKNIALIGLNHDITDLKKTEEELRQNHEQLQQFNQELEARVEERTCELENSEAFNRQLITEFPIGLASCYLDGQLVYVNPNFAKILGRTVEETLNLTYWDITPIKYQEQEAEQLQQLQETGSYGPYEKEYIHKDGHLVAVSLTGLLIQQNGETLIWSSVQDISDRKQSENALRDSQALLQTVLDAFPLSIFWKDRQSVILGCNRLFAMNCGMKSSVESIGKGIFDFSYTNDEALGYLADDQQVMESGLAKLNIEEMITLPSGEQQWVQTNKIPLRDSEGNVIGVMGTFQDISDRKQAEIALQSSEERFRRIFDSSVVGMIFVDFQGHIIDANDRFLEMVGYTREDFQTGVIDWLAMTPPEYLEKDYACMEYLIEHRQIDPWEKQYYRKDGSRVSILIGAALLQEASTETICVILDISDRKQAEIDLKESEQHYVSLMEASPVGIFRTDAMGHCTYINDRWCRIAGLTLKSAMGDGWRQGIYPEDRQSVTDEWHRSVQEHQPFSLEYRFQRLDGVLTWVYGQSVAKLDADGIVTGYVGTITDITDRKLAEQQLKESQQFLQTLLDTLPVHVFWKNRESVVLGCNQTLAELMGLSSPEEFVQITGHDFSYTDEELRDYKADDQEVIESGQPKLMIEETMTLPNGKKIWIETHKTPLRDYAGNITGVVGIFQDISDRKQAEEKLQKITDRLAIALKSAAIGSWEWDLINNVGIWDERMFELYGIDKKSNSLTECEILANALHPDDRNSVETLIQQAILGEAEYDTEFRIVHSDGSIHFIKAYGVVVRDAQGNPQSMVGVNFDISTSKLAEKALKQQIAAIEAAIDGIAVLQNNEYIYLNQSHLEICGYGHPDELLGKSWTELYSLEEITRFEQDVLPVLQRDRSWRGEAIATRKDSSTFAQELSLTITEEGLLICVCRDISDRKRTEETLNTERLRLKLALKAAKMGTWSRNSESDQLIWSDWVQEIFGFAPGTFPGDNQTFFSMIHPEDRDRVTQAIAHTFATGEAYHLEYRIFRLDGEMRWITVWGLPSETLSTNGRQLIGVIADISDRKQAEEALKISEERFRNAFDTTAVGMCLVSSLGAFLKINPSLCDFWGYSETELLKMSFQDITHPDDLASDLELLWQLLAGEITHYNLEKRYFTKDQRLVWGYLSVSLVKDSQDQPLYFVSQIQDISDRKQVEQQLQNLTDRLTIALTSGAIGCWEWDIAHNVITWDERMWELYGVPYLSSSTLIFDHWANGLHPEDSNAARTLVQQALAGEAEFDTEFRVIHPDRSIHFLKAYGVVLRDAQGNPQRMIGVNFDITAQKQAEETIRQQIEKETVLRQITQRIRETLDLQRIFDTACQDIRQFIQSDRVAIFRFHPDSGFDDGEFVAESVKEGFSSVLAIQVHDHCFGEDYAQRYTEGHFQVINDVLKSDLQDCHKAVLTQFQIRANLVMPLLLGKKLWGLLCIHTCDSPRIWQADEIDVIQQITGQLAIAIQQGDLYNQIQAELIIRQRTEEKLVLELQRKQLLGEIIQSVRDSLDITEILVDVTDKIQGILNCDRVIVFQLFPDGKSKIVEESVSDQFPSLKNLYWEDDVWSQEVLDCYWQGIPRIVPDVMNDRWTDCLVEYSTQGQIQSKIVAPILQEAGNQEDHRWVSSDKDRLWGVLVVHACGEKRVWQEEEAKIVQQIADQLAIAIQQADLFKRLQQKQEKLTQTNEALALSNEDLARATRLKDEFLANMSHELRTPLNAILGMTEGLEEEVFGTINQKQVKALQTIEKSGLHLLSLINDILDVAKIGSGQVELEYSSVSVTHLCSSSLVFIKQQALQKRIRLKTQIAPDLTNASVDERRIRQVLINLLTNAVKFTPEGGTITLTTSRLPKAEDGTQQHYFRIAVLDTGIGIAPENINKLFQPFVQIDGALNRQYAGTGLGLALVKQIVELHGGRVELTSQLGIGSCFAIDLPCASEPQPPLKRYPSMLPITDQDDDSGNVSEAPTTAPLILLAEDNEANISTISSYLTAKGYRIISAKNGKEAIAMIYSESPDLILMDVQMPEMDGLEAMRQLRQDPKLGKIPIIALTALAMAGDRERCLEAGANEHLAKPVKLRDLSLSIQKLLS